VLVEVMQDLDTTHVCGVGGPEMDLSVEDLRAIVAEALGGLKEHSRVLALIPDGTRDDNTDILFPIAAKIIAEQQVEKFDALVAQGTHPPMTLAQKLTKTGLDKGLQFRGLGEIYDHNWNEPSDLVTLGTIPSEEVHRLSNGLIDGAIPVRLNRLLAPGNYDYVLVFGATVPHEVAGFAGGAKYFFPGVAGPELTHQTHWLGALASIEEVIGRVETPTRKLIEAAADFVTTPIISLNSVVRRENNNALRTFALFAGDIRAAFRRAAAVSSKIHIKHTGHKYSRVVALLDEHYDEMWVGGKASYKLGAVIEEGGELIIYAPKLKCISETHGALIEKYGYAPLRRVMEMVEESDELKANLCVAAHLAHVSYGNSLVNNDPSKPRFRITMATGLDEETCRRVNLGWMDASKFNLGEYDGQDDVLIVENAGRDLYLPE
jgi:nickel-dependent lactate racemase